MRQDTYTSQAIKAAEDKINNDKACKKYWLPKKFLRTF